MTLTVDNQTFPCINLFKLVAEGRHVEVELYENFQKTSFRNRYVIAGANGLIHLTIPVVGGREQKALFRDVQIDDSTDWQTGHWRSITSAYRKAPFFEHYSETVRSLVFNSEKNLFSFNILIISKICEMLKINADIGFTGLYERKNSPVEGKLDFRNKFLPGNFQNEGNLFNVKYSQVFEDRLGFQPNLSILDLLFCEGPNAAALLTA
jgi:hypothetical protein